MAPKTDMKRHPIETAPRDGTVILLYFGDYASPNVGFWDESDKEWPWVVLDPGAKGRLNGCRETFQTHWAALPEASDLELAA